MTQLYASVAIATAATLLALFLLLLRADHEGRRPVLVLLMRWTKAPNRSSGLVLGLLGAVALASAASIPANIKMYKKTNASAAHVPMQSARAPAAVTPADSDSPAWTALQAYADTMDASETPTNAVKRTPSETAALPDVETMISKLVTRLEQQPDDVRGWKMLGWSYLNTEKPEQAAKAYETALKIDPDDIEIKKALDAARKAQSDAAPDAVTGNPR